MYMYVLAIANVTICKPIGGYVINCAENLHIQGCYLTVALSPGAPYLHVGDQISEQAPHLIHPLFLVNLIPAGIDDSGY